MEDKGKELQTSNKKIKKMLDKSYKKCYNDNVKKTN